jgi:hypothetical protein
MSRAHNCELSAVLERQVGAPAGMFVTVTEDGVGWLVIEELEGVERMALTEALVRVLDDGYTEIGVGTVRGRFQGVRFSCTIRVPAQTAHPSLSARHLAVVR